MADDSEQKKWGNYGDDAGEVLKRQAGRAAAIKRVNAAYLKQHPDEAKKTGLQRYNESESRKMHDWNQSHGLEPKPKTSSTSSASSSSNGDTTTGPAKANATGAGVPTQPQSSPSIGNDFQLPLFVEGGQSPSSFSAHDMNLLVRNLNAWNKLRVVYGDASLPAPTFQLTESNSILTIPKPGGTVVGGGTFNVYQATIYAITQTQWNVLLVGVTQLNGPATLAVYRPPELWGNIANGNINRYDSSYNLTYYAVNYAYNSDYTRRTASDPNGNLNSETQVIWPPVQPLYVSSVTSLSNGGGICTVGVGSPFPSPPFAVGQYVFFTNVSGLGTAARVLGGSGSSFNVAGTGTAGANPTVSFGGTSILIAQDIFGNWWDLNTSGRKWATASIQPSQ